MKYSEIIKLSSEEITARLAEEKNSLTKLKFAHSVSVIENPSRLAKIKKDIARLNTETIKRKTLSASETI